ncbi:MAG: AMP-binding protein, partial [bacterium]
MRGLMMDYPLTIGKIIQRANRVFADREVVSVLPSGRTHRYANADLYRRTVRLMNVLRRLGVKPGERVGTFMWNHHRHLELYFAIPSTGAVTHTLNVRLFPDQLIYIVNHAADAVIFVDASLLPALEAIAPHLKTVRQYVVVTEDGIVPETTLSPIAEYEALMADADETEDFPELDEFSACGMCYTSGTT